MVSTCVKCEQTKSDDEFYKHKKTGQCYRRCKACESERAKEYKSRTNYNVNEQRAKRNKELREAEQKPCSECNEVQHISCFEPRRNQCMKCRQKYIQEYHKQLDVKQRINSNAKLLKQNNPQALLKSRLRSRLYNLMKKHNSTKCEKTVDLIGCTWNEFVAHMESQFEDGMKWSCTNLSIDHKVPCSLFDLTDPKEQKRCFYYLNLQPMYLSDNIKKKDKLLPQYIPLYNQLKSMFA